MQVGLTQLIATDLSLDDLFKQASEAGYNAIELALRNEGELTPETPSEELQSIIRRAREAGLSLVSMCHSHVTGNLLGGGDTQREGIEQTIKGMHVACELNIPCTLHTLGRLSADVYYDQAYKNAVESLRAIAPTAEELNIDLAVEFVWNGFAFSPLEMKQLLDEVGSPRVGFYFDPGNMAVFHYPQHWVRILGPHIKRVHVKDWRGRALGGGWTPLLEGEVDFPVVMRELRDIGYDGPLISEVSQGDASLADTAAAIRRIAAM